MNREFWGNGDWTNPATQIRKPKMQIGTAYLEKPNNSFVQLEGRHQFSAGNTGGAIRMQSHVRNEAHEAHISVVSQNVGSVVTDCFCQNRICAKHFRRQLKLQHL
jgi:hypothetical protein